MVQQAPGASPWGRRPEQANGHQDCVSGNFNLRPSPQQRSRSQAGGRLAGNRGVHTLDGQVDLQVVLGLRGSPGGAIPGDGLARVRQPAGEARGGGIARLQPPFVDHVRCLDTRQDRRYRHEPESGDYAGVHPREEAVTLGQLQGDRPSEGQLRKRNKTPAQFNRSILKIRLCARSGS